MWEVRAGSHIYSCIYFNNRLLPFLITRLFQAMGFLQSSLTVCTLSSGRHIFLANSEYVDNFGLYCFITDIVWMLVYFLSYYCKDELFCAIKDVPWILDLCIFIPFVLSQMIESSSGFFILFLTLEGIFFAPVFWLLTMEITSKTIQCNLLVTYKDYYYNAIKTIQPDWNELLTKLDFIGLECWNKLDYNNCD